MQSGRDFENVVAASEELGALVRDGDLRCLTMGQLAREFQTKLTIKQGRNLSPVHTEHGYVEPRNTGTRVGRHVLQARVSQLSASRRGVRRPH